MLDFSLYDTSNDFRLNDTSSSTSPVRDNNSYASSSSSNASPRKHTVKLNTSANSPKSTSGRESTDRIVKRQKNTEAARRYRQRKVDCQTGLADALAAMTKERDELRLQLARSEAERDVLRGLVGGGR